MLEVRAGTAQGPCTQHHQGVGRPPNPLFLPNLQTTPVVTTGKEPARPRSGSEQGTCYLFLYLCAAAPNKVLCECLIWPLINFSMKGSKDPAGNSFSGRPLSLSVDGLLPVLSDDHPMCLRIPYVPLCD